MEVKLAAMEPLLKVASGAVLVAVLGAVFEAVLDAVLGAVLEVVVALEPCKLT